ncbi:MAG: [protein-PII] uridylyltransferase [Desulfobacterales bacterium CG23_combo_of_CG06-09_8_20_14_all_51_8]|nr:MAG: [protein-PII] uridylyltransferase [Desulfobacterales bacterium CG23_combo_of_CG06-09_8_20_14_all_51_8]
MNPLKQTSESYAGTYSDILSESRFTLFSSPFGLSETRDILKNYTMMIDQYFQNCFESSNIGPKMDFIRNPYAIIALGGYGRTEQSVHSDVDLLFLFQKHVPAAADELIREIVYPLWDLKMEVGYATRSIDDCILMARTDFEVLTSILDARFICGISSVFTKLRDQVIRKIVKRNAKKITHWLIERNRLRHHDFGDSTFQLQPNLKEGKGGLRDYHTLRWIAAIQFDLQQTRDLEFLGILSHLEYTEMMAALTFIWHVRNRLHLLAKRKCDQLYFEYQRPVAEAMGFTDEKGQSAVEKFLGRLHSHMSFIKNQLQLFLYESGYGKRGKWRASVEKISETPGIHLLKGRLNFDSPETIVNDPEMLIRIFEVSARLKIPLSRESERLVREFNYLVDDAFRASLSVRNAFEKVLLLPAPTFNVLEQMLNTGFLVSLIPEFESIVNRIQYDAYHLYPVDHHMLRTVYILKMFGDLEDPDTDDLCGRLFSGLKRKKLLLLAALMHDIGKGREGRHSEAGAEIAAKVLKRMGYSSREIDLVSFLIEHHLLLIKTATRRDINDEETAIVCARQIQDDNRLKMLYLLTVADSQATGPKAWNTWTASLLQHFFIKVLGILEKGELATTSVVNRMARKKKALVDAGRALDGVDAAAVFDEMSPRYVLNTPVKDILAHIVLYRRFSDRPFIMEVARDPEINSRTVTICAKDRPGLVSKIAGVFTLNNINILDAQANTWKNGIALDIFKVEPPPDQVYEDARWKRVEDNLAAVLAGTLNLQAELAGKPVSVKRSDAFVSIRPNRVAVDNAGSSFYTIIEVFSYDFKGLLYNVTDAIRRLGLNITVAKIATKVDQVVDVFYVRDENDAKVDDPAAVARIKKEILAVLPARPHE